MRTLADICTLITDGTHYTPPDIGLGVPFLTVKDMNGRSLDFTNCSHISEADYCRAVDGNSAPRKSDVLFSKDGTVGKVSVVDSDRAFAVLSSIAILRPDRHQVDPQYLGWVLRTPEVLSDAIRKKSGSAIRRIILNDLKKVKIPILSLREQRRIAEVLDHVDALREKRRKSINLLESLAQSIFLDMFSTSIESPTQPLGDHLTFVTSGGRGWAKYYTDSGARFVRSVDVRMNHVNLENAAFVNPPENAEASRTRISSGDVLLTITGSRIGRVAPATEELDGGYISQHVAILRPNPQTIIPEFLSFFLSLPMGGQRQIARLQYGQTKPGLNFMQIRKVQVPKATLTQQREFTKRLRTVQQISEASNRELAKLDALFASIQSRAFRGELWQDDLKDV